MRILRSASGLTAGLADYPFESHYVEVPSGGGQMIRMHYIDEGPRDQPPVVFVHGNPSWSYIWRHSVTAAVNAGHRCIAVDLVGMGLSDKPSEIDDYSVERHVQWLGSALFDQLNLHDITFVLHDWGGIIGLRLVAEQPHRFARISFSNTGFPERDPSEPLPDGPIVARGAFAAFQKMAREAAVWEPWTLLAGVMVTPVTPEVTAGYKAPYPDPETTIGSRAFTQLLPTKPDNPMLVPNWHAWKVLEQFERPFVTIFSDRDVVAPTGYIPLVQRVPGAKGQPHVILEGGGHFVQEDIPEAFNAALLDWMASTPSRVPA